MSTDKDPFSELALHDQSKVNVLCDQFEEALQQGLEPRIEDFLADTSSPVRDVLFRELLLLQCEHALRQGSDLDESRLAEHFPDQSESIREAMDLARTNLRIEAEVAGRSSGPAVWPSDLPQTFGRFRVLGVLGHGAFGTVVRAVDTENGNEVALKVPHLVTLVSPDLRERFFREARAAAALEHPGIVRLLEVGEEGLVCYIVSEYVSGTTLAAWLSRCYEKQERIPFETAARLVVSLAAAMEHAHEQGVFHYDLKPANVLLRDGRTTDPVVTDFGLARLVGEATQLTLTGQVLGTPAYMAPEQAFDPRRPLGPGPDVYGLGAILYELLTGRPPFQGPTALEIMLLKRNSEPISPRLLTPQVPRALETVCIKCLEEQAENRYRSARALGEDLERWLRGEPVQARPIGSLGRARRWCRRRPLIASLVAALALALLGGLTGVLLQWRRTETARGQAEAALLAVDTARREAEDSEAQVHELLNELLLPSSDVHVHMMGSRSVPDLGVLLEAEAHFLALLQRRPDDIRLRISLTNVEISLSRVYEFQGQTDQVEAKLQFARTLWESLVQQDPSNSQYRTWLAAVYLRQSEAASRQGQFGRSIRLHLQLYTLSQALADEQSGNDDAYMRILGSSSALLDYRSIGMGREETLRALQEEKALTEKLIGEDAAGTVDRKRLALVCLVLGEVTLGQGRSSDALPFWREAYEQYRTLARRQPDDLLPKLNLALCCSRLMAERASDSYYTEAVALFEQGADRLAALRHRIPASEVPHNLLMDTYCRLAVCHWRAGRTALAEQTFEQRVQPLIAELLANRSEYLQGIGCIQRLLRAGDLLKEAKPAALAVARQAAALAERLADSPSRDIVFCEWLTGSSVNASAMLCRLGDPATALRLAEHARSLSAGLRRAAPAAPHYGHALSDAWQRIGKARWELGRREEAMAAFREAAVVERQILEQAPSILLYKVRLSSCYRRLAYWGGLIGDRAGAAAALLERKELWPDDAKELHDIALSFEKLAEAVGMGRKQLSGEEQVERHHYLAESQRAVEASRKATISRLPP